MYGTWRDYIKYHACMSGYAKHQLDIIEELIGPPEKNEYGNDLTLSFWLRKAVRLGLIRNGEFDHLLSSLAQAL